MHLKEKRRCTVSPGRTPIKQYVMLHFFFYNWVRPTFMCTLKTKPSVLELVCWGLFSVFLYKAVFWLTCRYRKQRSAAQGMWSFFLSSSLVTISCKENRSFTKKVWPEEGSSRRKWVPACHSVSIQPCVARHVIVLAVGLNLARCHWWKREQEAAMLQTLEQPQSTNQPTNHKDQQHYWIYI